ncbi:MAG TPA: hypothetical protein VK787_15130 [Puia sp.]|jgi:hypothetical protein|nr:hypothetical protein [Puia sp.]
MSLTEFDVPVRMAKLTIGFLFDNLTESELVELDDWINVNMHNQLIFEELICQFPLLKINRKKYKKWRKE